jgi:sulfoxide reductase catalytic subunit YedY
MAILEVLPMNVIRRRGWEISDRLATPEHLVFNRRNFLAGGASALAMAPYVAQAQRVSDIAKLPDPSADLYPAKRNEKYTLDRAITDEKVNGNYNNFYEFGMSKTVATAAQALPIRPWTVKIDGMVEKPMEVGIDDLIRKLTLEERTYRHRCVDRFPVRQARRICTATRLRKICADGNLHESENSTWAEAALVPVALHRRPHHGRGDQ